MDSWGADEGDGVVVVVQLIEEVGAGRPEDGAAVGEAQLAQLLAAARRVDRDGGRRVDETRVADQREGRAVDPRGARVVVAPMGERQRGARGLEAGQAAQLDAAAAAADDERHLRRVGCHREAEDAAAAGLALTAARAGAARLVG